MRTLTALPTFDTLAIVFENCEELSVPLDDIRELIVSATEESDVALTITYRPRYRRLLAHNDITQLHLELNGCVVEWFTVMYEEDDEGNNTLQAHTLQTSEFKRPAYLSVRIGYENERNKTEEEE